MLFTMALVSCMARENDLTTNNMLGLLSKAGCVKRDYLEKLNDIKAGIKTPGKYVIGNVKCTSRQGCSKHAGEHCMISSMHYHVAH